MKKMAGLIYGPLEHHLDHLAVFCSLMKIPLILTEEELARDARLYYPDLQVIFIDATDAPFKITQLFETLFCSIPRVNFDEIFFLAELVFKKKIRTVWLPHGNSDKGHIEKWMEGLENEEIVLVYGPKMIDFLKKKKVFNKIPYCISIGNYRLFYYQKYKKFYESIINKIVSSSKKIILYAPTWKDCENSTSFFEILPHLIEQQHPDYFLLIKPHPNLLQDIRAEQLLLQYELHPNLLILRKFHPIYPLLKKTTIYLGDMSSIGYDFLFFNRPMFFLNPLRRELSDPGLFLHRCGYSITPERYGELFKLIEEKGEQLNLKKIRKETALYTFGSERNWDKVRKKIVNLLSLVDLPK